MKRNLLFIFLCTSAITVFAQSGSINIESYKKKIGKSDETIANPKKSGEPKTWQSRGELFAEIAELPSDGVWVGMGDSDLQLIMGKPTATVDTMIGEKKYKKIIYPHKKLYIGEDNRLMFWEINNYIVEQPYEKAFENYQKAFTLDAKGKLTKKLKEQMKSLSEKSFSAGLNEYQIGRYNNAKKLFATACNIGRSPEVMLPDTTVNMYAYYAGVLGVATQDYQVGYDYLKFCVENGYVADDLYANMATAMTNLNMDKEVIEKTLIEGYTKNPSNQTILIGLINHYLTTNDNPEKILPYLQAAQKQEPNNASLFLAEGNLWAQVKKIPEAEVAYRKALEIQPDFMDVYYNLGILFLTQGDGYIEQINKVERNNYKEMDRLDALADESFSKAVEPLEKVLNANPKNVGVLETLKNIYFRFRNKGPEMKAKFEEYNEKLKAVKE